MQNKTSNRLLILACLLLVGLIFILSKPYITKQFTPRPQKPFANIKPESVTEIILKNGVESSLIKKKNDRWVIEKDTVEYAADLPRLSQIINMVTTVTRGEVVSTNKSKHAEIGIGPKSITLKTPSGSNTLYLADTGLGVSNVRINNENEVFSTPDISGILTPWEYRDLSPHIITDEKKVSSVELTFNDVLISLKKQKDAWTVNDKTAKKEQVDYFINDLQTLKGTELEKNETIEENFPVMTIITTENGKQSTAYFYSKDETNYYVTLADSQLVYTVTSSAVESLQKDESYFTK